MLKNNTLDGRYGVKWNLIKEAWNAQFELTNGKRKENDISFAL